MVRVASGNIYKNICNTFPDKHFPVGGELCNAHRAYVEKGGSNGDEIVYPGKNLSLKLRQR